MPDTLIMLVT